MDRRLDPTWLRACVAVAVTLSPSASARGESPSAAAYLTPQSVAAATVRLADAVRMPMAQAYPIEVLAAATDDFLGLPLQAIERVTAVIDPPVGINPQYVVVLNASAPISLEAFRTELTQHTTPGELLGRPLLESQEAFMPSYCLADDQTLLIGPKLYLKRLLRGTKQPSGDLFEAMRGEGASKNHLHAAIVLEPLKPFIELGVDQAKAEAQPEAHKFLDGVLLLKQAVLEVDLSGERPTGLTIKANDAAAADRLEGLLADGLYWFRQQMRTDENFAKLKDHPEAVARAWVGYVERMFDLQAERMSTLRRGDDAFVIGGFDGSYSMNQLGAVYVIGILVALLLPAVQAAREAARRNVSLYNVKQLGLAMHNYYDENRAFPAHAIYSEADEPLLSWRVAILPYLGEQELYARFKKDEPWNSEHNLPLLAEMPELFLDPSSPGLAVTDGKTSYLGVVGADAAFTGDASGRKFRHFTDGTSKTIAIVQVADEHAVEWSRPADYDFAKHRENPYGGIGSLHPGVFLAGFADAHAEAIEIDTDPGKLAAFMTASGGEVVVLP